MPRPARRLFVVGVLGVEGLIVDRSTQCSPHADQVAAEIVPR
jgi:hypothetical protein